MKHILVIEDEPLLRGEVSSVLRGIGHVVHITPYVAVKEDITDRKRSERERNEMEVQLRHAQKLGSIGELAAGIAHVIDTPTEYNGYNNGLDRTLKPPTACSFLPRTPKSPKSCWRRFATSPC